MFNKILSSIALLLILSVGVMAQVPQGFNFQAVATAPDGTPLSSVEIGVQIEVVKSTEEGDVVYTETHTVSTNPVGLFQIVIGEGTAAESNDFSTINWGNDNYFVGFGVDLTGTGTFESLGKTRLLSVPYALLAQDVVNSGSGGTGEFPLAIDLDASTDTAFTVKISGDEGPVNNSAIIGEASTAGTNAGVEGKAISQAGSNAFQVGVYGEVGGEGTGTHTAVFGSAINDEGTGGRRYGLYGQARSSGRENIGGFGVGLGPGDGEIVLRGEEFSNGEFNVGGFNIGMIGFARQNLNGNIGVRGYVYGVDGARSNRALQAEARTEADGVNIGLQALVNGSNTENIGIEVDVYDEDNAKNLGAVLNVGGSSVSNIGLIVNAETAAELNGNTTINGNLVVEGFIEHSGTITQTSDGRLKTNVKELTNTLDHTLALRGVSYNWIDENKTQETQIGVIAQEVEEVYPEFVHTDDEGLKSVNYSQMVAVLIEAVKELNGKIEVLEDENAQLQAQVDDIEAIKTQINTLMSLISSDVEIEELSTDK